MEQWIEGQERIQKIEWKQNIEKKKEPRQIKRTNTN